MSQTKEVALCTVLRIRSENIVVTKHIKLNEMVKRYCKKEKKKIVTIINVAYGIRTYNAWLKIKM